MCSKQSADSSGPDPTFAEAAEDRSHQRIVVTHQISAPRDITHAMRTQFNSPTKDETDSGGGELDVQVQIEHAVMVDYNSAAYSREDYRKPRVIWDRKQGVTQGERTSEQNQWELSSVGSAAKSTETV